jgi:pimeloyl-ACP methyl ester carboxylesterase
MNAFAERRPGRSRPAVICLHSSGGSGGQWRTLAVALAGDFDVQTPDLYGHGGGPAWRGAPEDIVAADTARIAGLAAGSREIHLVGHSYGGAIALRVALQMPGAVASVCVYEPVAMRILFDFNPRHRAAAEVADVARQIRRELNGGSMERAAQRFVDYWSGRSQWAEFDAERRSTIVRCMPAVADQFVSLARDRYRLPDYGRLGSPVLFLSGRQTRSSTRRIGELLRYAMPHVDSATMSGMGHLGPLSHPQTVARSIESFIRRHSSAAPAMTQRMAA